MLSYSDVILVINRDDLEYMKEIISESQVGRNDKKSTGYFLLVAEYSNNRQKPETEDYGTFIVKVVERFINKEITNERLLEWLSVLEPDCFEVGYPINAFNPIVMYINEAIKRYDGESVSDIVKKTLEFFTDENRVSIRDLLELLVKVCDALDYGVDEHFVADPFYQYFCSLLKKRGIFF